MNFVFFDSKHSLCWLAWRNHVAFTGTLILRKEAQVVSHLKEKKKIKKQFTAN